MKIAIIRPCFVAGSNRVVGEVVEGESRDLSPAIGANRAVAAPDDAKAGKKPARPAAVSKKED